MDAANENGLSGGPRRLLLHACCGPCSTHCVEAVRRMGYEPTLFYANDNIAHETEHARRLESLESFARREGVPVVVPEYDHSAWLSAVSGLEGEPEGGSRCAACFRHSLRKTLAYASQAGYGEFTTTLSVSPHKRSAMLFEAGREVAKGVPGGGAAPTFLECDFKKGGGFLRSIELARAYGLYRQEFCGCEFSRRKHSRRVGLGAEQPERQADRGPAKMGEGGDVAETLHL
jgi:hypothetical protein